MFDVELLDRIIRASVRQPNMNQVLRTAGLSSRPEPHDKFCLQFSERIARRYLAGELSFADADAAANWLFTHSYVAEGCPGEMPTLAREIFDAFDSGEFHHKGDDLSEDPEKKYTLAQIRSIVESRF